MVDFNRAEIIDRPRRRALMTFAVGLIAWIGIYEARLWYTSSTSTSLSTPPHFFVDLEHADEDELRLLPNVGQKTAKAWRESFDTSMLPIPKEKKDLELLPNVGPKRADRLAPHLIEIEDQSGNQ